MVASPLSFFHANPVGVILSRFAKDQDIVDSEIPPLVMESVHAIFVMVSTVISIIVIVPWFIGAILLFGIMFWFLFAYFRRTGQPLKRMEIASNAPIYAFLGEALNGVSSVK